MKKITCIALFLLLSISVFGQNQAANWYFGYGAGMKFDLSANTLNIVDDGQLSTNEGCASISDSAGRLLFYTDGSTVWNRNHDVMQNGSGLFGDSSSTQSAIIVPKPGSNVIYYVFTVDNNLSNGNFGLNYSIVDMTNNGGLGNVVSKNLNLLPLCSEKISAVLKDCLTKSIWVITFASENGNSGTYNSFHAYEVSDSGVNTTPVTSTFSELNISEARGYLKLSPDGSKLASANMGSGLFIYDFNVATGIVSNPERLLIGTGSNSAYGVEFSPNSQLLYIHSSNDSQNADAASHSSTLSQFNLGSPDIQGSRVTLDDRQLYRGGLQLGPDGRIYRALSSTYNIGYPFLGVINNPNTVGVGCDYQHNGVDLSPNTSSQGLPPFIQSIFNLQVDIIQNEVSSISLQLCTGDEYTLTSEAVQGATYTWTLDGEPLPEADFDLVITQGGHYQVFIEVNNGDCDIEGQAFVTYNNVPEANDTSLIQCDEDGTRDAFTTFNINQAVDAITGGTTDRAITYFLSAVDAENEVREIDGNAFDNATNPQTVYARVANTQTGCYSVSQVLLQVSATSASNGTLEHCDDDGTEDGRYSFNLSDADAQILTGLPLNLNLNYYKSYNDALLEINSLGTNYTNATPYSEIIYARVENANACFGISEVQLTVYELPNVETEFETLYCINFSPQPLNITGGVIDDNPNNYSYAWSTGESTSDIMVTAPGIYTVRVSNSNGCFKDRTVNVLPSNIATITNIEVIDGSLNNNITVLVTGEGDYEYALDDVNGPYQDSNTFSNVMPGLHTVYVRDKNDCGIVNEIVSVIGFPKFFSPNNDGFHDYWQVYGITERFQPMTTIRIFDRYGKLLKELNPLGPGWDGTFNGTELPNSDYWFSVDLEDGRNFKSHFTLKR